MANLDATLMYTDPRQEQDDHARYCLRPQPSSESLRTLLNTLSDPVKLKRCKRRSQHDPDKHRLLHLSKKLLQVKPQIVKEQEDEVKKITRERLFRGKQQERAQRTAPNSAVSRLPILSTACLHPRRLGQHQINLIKDQIHIIKQDISQIYPDIPSPKNDAWFRLDQLDSVPEVVHPARSHSLSSRIPQQSRVFVEKSVCSLNRKIQSIKRNNSQSSSLAPSRRALAEHLTPTPTAPSSHNLSPTPSLTNSSISLPTPITNQSRHSSSPLLPNQIPSPPSFLENSQWGARHPTKAKFIAFPGSIKENDESLNLPSASDITRPYASLDQPRSSSTSSPPTRLSIVTQGISDAEPAASRHSFSHTPLRRDTGTSLSPVFSLTPISCLDTLIMRSQRKSSPFELILEESQKQNRRVSLSNEIVKPSVSSASRLLDRNMVNRERSRSSRSLQREPSTQLKSPNIFMNQPVQLSIPFVNSPSEIETHSRDSIRLWRTNFGRTGIDNFEFFVKKEQPNDVLLVTDVLIEQQGGLSFLGQENFNERFRTKPWQTMKTIHQYDCPGKPDAQYVPGISRVEVVQTPHSPKTFPLPTPEWYWVTEFTIDRQSRPVDGNGWEYYDLFSRKWSPRRHGCKTFVRRRWWVRVRAKLRASEEVDLPLADLPAPSVSLLDPYNNSGASSSNQSKEKLSSPVVTVILMKVGNEDCITFNSTDVEGGHSLMIELPEGISSVEVHWDDSALVPLNPIFSLQTVASEIFNRILLAHPDGLQDETRQEILESLYNQLTLINFKRVSKTFSGLLEPQKIRLWKYWLDLDHPTSSTKPSAVVASAKPNPKDVWKIIDRHFEQVLELFTFDAHRVKFLHLILTSNVITLSTTTTTTTCSTTTPHIATTEQKIKKIVVSNSNNNQDLINEIHVDFWSNFLHIISESNKQQAHHHQQHNNNKLNNVCTNKIEDVFDEALELDVGTLLKVNVSLDLRNFFNKLLKSHSKIKRATTLSK